MKETDDFIIQKIRSYKAIDAIAKTAALLLIPELHANNVRIEHLLNLISKNAKGKKIINRGILHQLLNIKLSDTHWARMEDPPEDLFSGNIALSCGNFLMLESLWEENISLTQAVLDALQYLIEKNEYKIIYKTVCDILKISNTILSEAGISAYMLSAGVESTELSLPDNNTLTNLSCILIFDVEKLNALNVLEKSIEYFVLQDLNTIDDISQIETALHNYPIIKIDDKYIVIPSFLGFAIRKFVLRSIENKKLLENFGKVLFNQQAHKTFRFIKESLIENIKLSTPDDLKFKIVDNIYSIDNDKIAHIIFFMDTLEKKADKDWNSFEKLPSSLIDYMKYSSEILSQIYYDGIIILIFGNIGGGIFFGTSINFSNFKLASFSVHDFELLLLHKDFSLLKLWKCMHEQDALFNKGTKINNYNGDINLYAFWLHNNYSFVPHDNSKSSKYDIIIVSSDYLIEIRKYIRPLINIHSAKFREDEYVVVQRKDVNSYFQSYNTNRIYVAIHYVFSRMLIILIEGNTCNFWLHFNEIGSAKSHEYFELTYKIFELVVFWLEKGIEQIEHVICNDKPYIFHIDVSFVNFDKYSFEDIEGIPDDNSPVQIKYNFEGFIYITIDIAFLKKMCIPENTAEQELIATIINTINRIINYNEQTKENTKTWEITRNIFKHSKYSRQLHFFTDSKIEDNLPVTKNDIILLPKEEIASVENTLDFSISALNKQEIINKLNNLVSTLYADLIKRLVIFDKKYLIIRALENHDKILMTAEQWRRTAAAIIATHSDSAEAHDVVKEQLAIYAESSQASRILSEIALCHCSNNGKEISIVEIEYLLALVYKIIEFGRISDALYYDIVGIDIFGEEDGALYFKNNKAIYTIMDNYQNTVASNDINQNIKTYDRFYKKYGQEERSKTAGKLLDNFNKAYKEDFGFNCELPFQISVLLAQFASNSNKTHLDLSYDEILKIIMGSPIQFETEGEIKKCIDYFTLNIRNQFEEQKGSKYFKNNNVWLYKRPLSPLLKPFIKITAEKYLLFPRLLCRATEYFFDFCYYGEINHDLFGKKMRTYFGHKRNEIGKNFNDNVAKWFVEQRYKTKSNLQMKTIGVKKNDIDLGDIDVLAFNETRNIIYIIECKNLERAMTPKDMGQQIKRFLKGNDRWLSRHIARYKWVIDNKDSVMKKLKMGTYDTKIIPILLVNDIIPMQFMNTLDYPTENIITMSDLKKGFLYKAKENYYPKNN